MSRIKLIGAAVIVSAAIATRFRAERIARM